MPISTEELELRFGPLRPVDTPRREYGWGDRLGASVDRFQGQVQGTMEELGFDTGDARRQNEAAARYARQRAIEDTGAPQSFGETFESPTKFARGVGGLFVDSAPELALSLGTGFVGGLAGVGTMGRLGLAAAANYPGAVGDILGNQRDESGRTDAGSAFALGVPYVAADMLGLDAALASGKMMRTGIRALDDMQGFKGGLYRTGANALMNVPVEGGNESFQEGLNQAGRMAVNPEQTLFNDEANARYLESFGSGALMGGAASAALGGWQRSPGYEDTRTLPANRTVDDEKPVSLLGEEPARDYPLALQGERGLATNPAGFDRVVPVEPPDTQYGFGSGQIQLPAPAPANTQEQAQRSGPGVLAVTPAGTVAPIDQLSGQQYDAFGGPDTFGAGAPTEESGETPAPPDTATRDMFQETPTALVPTMFNPATEPQGQGSRGAVAGNIRSQIMQQVGRGGDATLATTLSLDLAQSLGDAVAMVGVIDARRKALESSLKSLDRKVTGDSNLLTPEEYAERRAVLDNKLLTLMAAEELVQRYQRATTNAFAQEGAARAQPGQNVGVAPTSTVAEQGVRETALAAKVAETDEQAARSQEARTREARLALLREVMAEPTRGKPMARFRARLREQGYTSLDLTPAEQDELVKLSQRRSDVRAATVVPPGLAAARGRLTPRSSLDATQDTAPATKPDVAPVQPRADVGRPVPAQRTAPAAAAAPVLPASEASATALTPAPADPKLVKKLQARMEKYEKLLVCLRKPG